MPHQGGLAEGIVVPRCGCGMSWAGWPVGVSGAAGGFPEGVRRLPEDVRNLPGLQWPVNDVPGLQLPPESPALPGLHGLTGRRRRPRQG